jgi:hypothetical protein
MVGLSERMAFEVARALAIDVDDPRICQLCLSFVSMELDTRSCRSEPGVLQM